MINKLYNEKNYKCDKLKNLYYLKYSKLLI